MSIASRSSSCSSLSSDSSSETSLWMINNQEYQNYLQLFKELDKDKDGKITDAEALEVLAPSGLSAKDLDKIFCLSDIDQDTYLDLEEFIIAKFLVNLKLNNHELPDILPENLLPTKVKYKTGRISSESDGITPESPIYSMNMLIRKLSNFFKPLRLEESITGRPGNLPPKTAEENVKHIKEIEKIKKKLEKELKEKEKEIEKKNQIKLEREKKILESCEYWKIVIDTWPEKFDGKTIKLWWQGFPPKFRGKMWELGIGNELNVTIELFQIFGTRAKEEKKIGREDTVSLIPLDLPRTFPALSFFQKNGPMHINLRNVLEAYVCYRPDVGYVQGMSYLAAMLLLNMEEFSAFKCLCNILNKPSYLLFYKMDIDGIRKYINILDFLIYKNLPKIYNNLKKQNISLETFFLDWFLTIFSKSLPLDISVRIWDLFFLEGEAFIFRTSISLLKYFNNILENGNFDECVKVLTNLPPVEEEILFQIIEKIDITKEKFQQLLKEQFKLLK